MAIRTKRRVLAAAVEASEGVAETLDAADGGLLVSELKWSLEVEQVMRDFLTDTLSKIQSVPGKRFGSFTFTTELKGKSTAFAAGTVVPEIGKYLKACGFSEVVDATALAETVTYEPVSDSTAIPTLTMGLYNDGRLVTLRGCRGTVSFECNNGEYSKASFEFSGMITSVADATQLSVDLSSEIALNPPLLLGASFSMYDGTNTHAAKISSLSVDMANTVTMREDMSQEHGYFVALITDRTPTGKINPEFETEATYPFLGNWLNGQSAEITFSYGTVQYNTISFTIPKATTTAVADGEREDLSVAELDFTLNTVGSGDDEITIVFS